MIKKLDMHKKWGMRRTYERLNQMIDTAMDGNFEEGEYEETELSKLEVKWKRFLTSARLSNQKLEEERRNIKELVSDISHQTKTPLANILLYSQLLEEQNLDETGRELVSEIVKQSAKLDSLLQLLVKTSRLEAGTFQFQPKSQEITKMLQEIVEQVRQKAKKRGIRIMVKESHEGRVDKETECGEVKRQRADNSLKSEWKVVSQIFDNRLTEENNMQIKVVCDRKWTTEAIYNILDNAVKYGKERSTIDISVNAYELFVCITIRNEGKGIPEEEIPRIFQRFYRGNNASETEGVGIGLYLARQIVEAQGGYIKVTSEADGKTGFSVYLPKGSI